MAQKLIRQFKKVSGVELCTAGIVSNDIQIPNCGRVTMYDFAGQPEYYCSHAAICENLMTSQGCLMIIMFNLSKDHNECVRELQYWQQFINNQLRSCAHYPPIIFVASYADVVKSRSLDPGCEAKQVVETSFGSKCSHEIIFLDCRLRYSPGLQTISQSITQCCSEYQRNNTVETKIHLLLHFLKLHFTGKVACLVKDIDKLIRSLKRNKVLERNGQLPNSVDELSGFLTILNESGELLYLKNDSDIKQSWIILRKDALLKEINGTIFAPENFKNHHEISNSTGVVPLSNIRRVFPHHDPQMLIGFMMHLELCHEIFKSEANLINKEFLPSDTLISETFYFFPALVKVELSDQALFSQSNNKYRYGWCLQRANMHQC